MSEEGKPLWRKWGFRVQGKRREKTAGEAGVSAREMGWQTGLDEFGGVR